MALKVGGTTVVDDSKNASLLSVEALGSANKLAAKFSNIKEKINTVATAPAGWVTIDLTTASIWRFIAATANWNINVRGSSTATLNSLMDIGDTVSLSVMVPQGSTGFYSTAVQIDGVSATIWWAGAVPTGGYPNCLNVYSYAIEKIANNSFIVYASQAKFAV